MQGGIGYECTRCPSCGSLMWNGLCEDRDCKYHYQEYHEETEDENEDDLER